MATIKDVAKKAGVSVSTVSYTLSGVRPVSEETRKRVQQAIDELNYHPNLLARGLINKRTRIIALLYPAPSLASFDDLPVEFILSVTSTTYDHDYGLLLITHPVGQQEILQIINQGLVDGVILMEVLRHDPRADLMKANGFPFSLIGHGENNEGISFVDMDFYTSNRIAVEHLAQLNHRHIAMIPFFVDTENAQHNYLLETIRGFRETIQRLGLRGTMLGSEPNAECSYEVMKELLEKYPDLTAVIVSDEPVYIGVSKALQEKGLKVPDDFSIIGGISDRSAVKYTPQITTVSIPAIEMGRLGAEFLIQRLENPNQVPQQVILPPKFTNRQSTGPWKERKKP